MSYSWKVLARQPASNRYLILVNGEVEEGQAQKTESVRRAKEIAETAGHWKAVEVFDSWTGETFFERFRR